MTFEIRYTLNRGSATLKPKQKVLDWLKDIDKSLCVKGIASFDLLDEHGDTFLIPSKLVIDSRDEAVAWVEANWQEFLEFELGQWILDDTLWPQNPTLQLFRDWFDIEYHSMVWDLGAEPLQLQDWLV